ncbi:MAG: sulfotransferase [Pseudomonadota bacterium]
MTRDHILIIGAMKSGTTTLFDLLAQHPAIAPAEPKEPGFFAFEEIWARGFEWYEGLFAFDPAVHRYLLDGSTDYAKAPFCDGVPERLAAAAPRRFKLLYILRHPLRRIESHARHTQRTRKELGQIVSDRADHGLDAGVSPVSLACSRYASQVDGHRAAFEAGDLMLLSFEDLVADQDRVMRRVLAFLDLPEISFDATHANEAGSKSQLPGWWQGLTASPAAGLVKRLLPRGLREKLRAGVSRKIVVEGRFHLTEREEAALLDDLAEDLRRLRDVYGFDIEAHWGLKI